MHFGIGFGARKLTALLHFTLPWSQELENNWPADKKEKRNKSHKEEFENIVMNI